MKIVIFTLLFFSQCLQASSESVFDFLAGKITNMAQYISSAIKTFSEKMAYLVFFRFVNKEQPETDRFYVDRPVDYEQMKNTFTDYTKEAQSGNNWKSREKLKIYPGLMLATPQLALWHGREMESHVVQTKDGYFLTVHRITADPFLQANRTVLLHHGLLGSSTDWILLGPTKSLPYILSDAGYDVWITNARGNYYSQGHVSKIIGSLDYWNFSWQQMGDYDLPAVIDYIRKTKKLTESINFIGHSMGATALLVLLSKNPEYNAYLRVGILLAPLAFMSNVKGPLKILSEMSEELVKELGDGEFLPSRKVPSWLTEKYCNTGPRIYCTNPLLFLSGISPDVGKWTPSFIARLVYHVPAGGSTGTLLHYMQLCQTGKFHMFNDADTEFRLNNVTVPLAIMSSNDDWLATVPDVLKLYFNIPNPIDHHIIKNMNVSHTDFVWGVDANLLIFNKIQTYLESGLTWDSVSSNEI